MAMILLLLTCCLLLLPLWEYVIVLCFVVHYFVPSSFAIILMGKRQLVALLSLSSWCLVIAVWLLLAMPWVCLQFVIVVLSDHTHYFCLIVTLKYQPITSLHRCYIQFGVNEIKHFTGRHTLKYTVLCMFGIYLNSCRGNPCLNVKQST